MGIKHVLRIFTILFGDFSCIFEIAFLKDDKFCEFVGPNKNYS